MAMLLAGASLGLFGAVLARARRRGEPLGVDVLVLAGALALVAVGLTVTLLATFGVATPRASACAVAAIAVGLWRWGWRPPPTGARWQRIDLRAAVVPAALVLATLALRWPAMDYALAGRDQGSYTLRAEFIATHGRFDFIDPVLAAAGAAEASRPGPGDLLGLYPRRGDAWRDGVYEAAYRPGWYLADRELGHVVPQFFHLHPATMAAAIWIAGDHGIALALTLEAGLVVLAMFAIGRRLFGHTLWGAVSAAIVVVSPVAIWVHRNNLTETLTALIVACSALAGLRAREGREHELVLAAFLLGAAAWVRGNGWLTAPVVLLGTALVPSHVRGRQRPAIVFAAMLVGSIVVHGTTVFPYVYDELHRLITWWSTPSVSQLIGLAVLALAGWWSVDELVFGPRGRLAESPGLTALRGRAFAMVVAVGIALVSWGWLRTAGGPTWSRLDALGPMLGPVLGAFALAGAVLALPRKSQVDAAHAWLVTMASLVVVTAALYLPHTLPTFGLYYYGRYLVPEILPAMALLAVHTLQTTARVLGARLGGARAVTSVGAAMLVGGVAAPLALSPVTRLVEFAGTGRLVEALAARIPEGSVVIAGGEGWHHGHTFNQVAGALAIRHNRTIVPYVTREAAIASLWELLINRPAATGESAPPVFLLINEATHAVRPRADGPTLAAFDDLLPPPFAANSIVALELAADRLTPSVDALPTRVTRDQLRMVLDDLVSEPQRTAELRRWWPRREETGQITMVAAAETPRLAVRERAVSQPAKDGIAASSSLGGPLCLRPGHELVIELPEDAGVVSLALVATPNTSAHVGGWHVWADDLVLASDPPATSARARDTLGPWNFATTPKTLRIRGSNLAVANAPCPYGGVAELRAWSTEHGALADAALVHEEFMPPDDLGHPTAPARWVSGRGLSRYRSGVGPKPELRAVSLGLRPGAPLEFPPERPPGSGPVDIVVNLTAAALSPAARIVVRVDGAVLGEFDPPDSRERSWQSPILALERPAAVARVALELRDASADDVAWVRDVGLFSRP